MRLDSASSPRSIAVVRATRHPGKIGYAILRNLIVNEYQGILYPVDPNAKSIRGIAAYPNFDDIPDLVNLAAITVPVDLAVEALQGASRRIAQLVSDSLQSSRWT
jgi:acyl-CoA synthetase (NDP forming)